MKALIYLLLLVPVVALAESNVDDLTPEEAYARGFKEGWKEGYAQARRDAGNTRSNAPTGTNSVRHGQFPITVSLARYGTTSRDCDATLYVARRANGKLSATVDATNSICGDPAPGSRKSLEITYVCGNRAKTASAYEHRSAYLSCSD